ncbi:membrane protein FdrA [Peptococcaceae bacterium CEB3]|nr:membrane protein FdrA [Peptococcaceae bacterium CEB3]
MSIRDLFVTELAVINLGVPSFYEDLLRQGQPVIQVDWKPPAGGNQEMVAALEKLETVREKIEAGNREAFQRLSEAHPYLEGIGTARDLIPGLGERMLLHAGPPISWEHMSGPVRGAIIGAILYESWAQSPQDAEELAASGGIAFSPAHEHNAVGPMAGIISPSMPVFIIHNRTHGNYAYCTLNEGLGKVLRFGAFGPDVLERLKWMAEELAPALKKALQLSDGIDLKSLMAQMLHMGDEGHNRNKAGTSLFYRIVAPLLLKTDLAPKTVRRCLEFIDSNDHFFLNLSMPACKAMLDAAVGVEYSTLVTTMTRNGTDFGLRVAGTGNHWFTAPANYVEGLLFPGFTPQDANPDLGDSAITETCGLGGFAMAAAPAIVQFVGGTASMALEFSNLMYQITYGENPVFTIPALNFRGTPTGIDVRQVVELGLLPVINTGIAHREAGIGQVGAGLVRPPMACFEKALSALAESI